MNEEGEDGTPEVVPSGESAVVRTVGSEVHVVTAVVEALEEAEVELPGNWTLNDYVDADALERLFEPTLGGSIRERGAVTIQIETVTVVLQSDEETTVSIYTDE